MRYSYFDSSLPHVIVVGGGFGGLELIKSLGNKPVRVTLFDANNFHTFQPLLYQVASGGLGSDAIAYPLRRIISRFPNISFRMAEVQKVEPLKKTILTSIGEFPYDYLVLATGSQTNFFGNKELEQTSMQLKSVVDAVDLRSLILQEFEQAVNNTMNKVDPFLHFVVVGGGPTGVETAGALAEIKRNVLPADYKELDASLMKVHLVEAAPRLLNSFSEISSEKAMKFLEELGVEVKLNISVKSYDGSRLTLSSGEIWETETVVWAAGVMGKSVDGVEPSVIGRGNRYQVNTFNQVQGYTDLFAIGDIALMGGDEKFPKGHPMVAQPAIQQGKLLASNLLALIRNKPMKSFRYKDLGSMATVGRHKAVFEAFGIRMQGIVAWLGWMFLHLMYLVGFRNRVVVFISWMWNYLSYQRLIRIIIRPYSKKIPGIKNEGGAE